MSASKLQVATIFHFKNATMAIKLLRPSSNRGSVASTNRKPTLAGRGGKSSGKLAQSKYNVESRQENTTTKDVESAREGTASSEDDISIMLVGCFNKDAQKATSPSNPKMDEVKRWEQIAEQKKKEIAERDMQNQVRIKALEDAAVAKKKTVDNAKMIAEARRIEVAKAANAKMAAQMQAKTAGKARKKALKDIAKSQKLAKKAEKQAALARQKQEEALEAAAKAKLLQEENAKKAAAAFNKVDAELDPVKWQAEEEFNFAQKAYKQAQAEAKRAQKAMQNDVKNSGKSRKQLIKEASGKCFFNGYACTHYFFRHTNSITLPQLYVTRDTKIRRRQGCEGNSQESFDGGRTGKDSTRERGCKEGSN